MTPEELAKLQDSVARLEDTINNLNTGIESLTALLPRFGGSMRTAGLDVDKTRDLFRRAGETLEEYNARLNEITALQVANAKALEEEQQAIENTNSALYSLSTGANQLKEALLSTERTLGKYSGTLDNAGDAAIDLGKNFGAAGLAAGIVFKGFTTLASAGLKQADAQLKATDALAKVGATGTLTADQVLDMGHAAGLTSKNLELFTKPLQSIGPALVSLGGTSKQAVEAFADMTAIQKEQRQAFQRLGISQEELIQNQADYVKLQQISGASITANDKASGRLKNASLEYTENLLKLSAITGKSIDEAKKDQEIARAGTAALLQQARINREIREAEKNGDTDRANALRAELKARNSLLDTIQTQIGDADLLAGAQQFLATGAITDLSQGLLQLGIPLNEFKKRIEAGEDVTADFMEAFKRGMDRNESNFGSAAALLSDQTLKVFGITDKTLQARAAMGERDEKEVRQRTAAEIAAGKQAGLDGIKDARATMTEAEIVLQKGVDNLVQVLNPLQLGFVTATAAAVALSGAAYMAAKSLMGVSTAGTIGNATDALGNTGRFGKLGSLVKGGTSLAKFGGALTGVIAVGSGISTAMEGSKAADQAVADGTMTKAQGEQAKEEAKYTGGGEAIGGVLGGALGMMAGPLGAAIGGTIGSKLGGFIGGWIASRDDEEKLAEAETQEAKPQQAGPPPTLEELRAAAKDATALQASSGNNDAAIKLFNERLRNTQALSQVAPATTPTAAQTTPDTTALQTAAIAGAPVAAVTAAQPTAQVKPQTVERATQTAETPTQDAQKQKTWFERNKSTITGMALGMLGGPFGVIAGGLIGKHFDSKREDKEEKELVAKKEEDLRAEEAEKLAASFKNLSASIDIVSRNVIQLDKSFDDMNFAIDDMASNILGEDEAVSPAEQMARDYKQAMFGAMIDLRRLYGRASVTTGSEASQSSTSAGSTVSGGGSVSGGSTTPSVAMVAGGPAETAAPGAMGTETPSATPVGGGDEVQMGQEVRIGDEIRRGGTVSWRTNNPGNISYSGIARKHGAIGTWKKLDGDAQQRSVGIAIMPTPEAGLNLKMEQWRRPKYIDLPIDQGVSQWVTGRANPVAPHTENYANDLARAAGVSTNTVIGQLSDQQLRAMVEKQKVWEGFKEGQILKAAQGGIASGPKSGYPALLHGKEAIVPLASNSLLEKIAKTPETQPLQTSPSVTTNQTFDSPSLNKSMQELTALNAEMMTMMQEKLDEMIDKLGAGNDINKKIYKTALV